MQDSLAYLLIYKTMLLMENTRKVIYKQQIMENDCREGQASEQVYQSQELTFTIKKLDASEKVTQVSVSFPVVSRASSHGETVTGDSEINTTRSLPVFNQDYNYFTPCFVLESDKAKVQRNLNFYMNYHLNRVEEVNEEKQEILVPRPSKNHSFCGICRVHYEDYLTHIGLQIHQENIKKAKLEKNINVLHKILIKKDKREEKKLKQLAKLQLKTKPVKKERKPRGAKIAKANTMEASDVSTQIMV